MIAPDQTKINILEAALSAHHAGLCVAPPTEDGRKMPSVGPAWYNTRADEKQIREWYGRGHHTGLGIVMGARLEDILDPVPAKPGEPVPEPAEDGIARVETLDYDNAEKLAEYLDMAEAAGVGNTVARVRAGYCEKTPKGGEHWLYYCTTRAKNTKLAQMPDENGRPKATIETRGWHGFVIVAPSYGRVHDSGLPYVRLSGGFDSIVTISAEERKQLHDLARCLDEMPRKTEAPRPVSTEQRDADDLRPGDDFAARTNWADILEPHGWERVCERGARTYWRRPGKKHGISANTAIVPAGDLLYVFSTSTVFDSERGYGKFSVYAMLNCAGDFSAAAKELAGKGFGTPPTPSGGIFSSSKMRAEAEESADPEPDTWPAPLDEAAFYGLAGEIVGTIAPESEADPAALLTSLLVAVGNAAGRSPHAVVGATEHHANLDLVLVGATSKGRKGTSWDPIERLTKLADESWGTRVVEGMSSGEGLPWAVRDPIAKNEAIKEKGRIVGYQQVIEDPGVDDKRLMVVESELVGTLQVLSRVGNTLAPMIRRAWDSRPILRTLTKNSPATATGAHISFIGHIVRDELLRNLADSEVAGGTANRKIWAAVRRSQCLPEGGNLPPEVLEPLGRKLADTLNKARIIGRVGRDAEAKAMWAHVYPELSDGGTGLFGQATARAEAQALRLSLIYALLDKSDVIRAEHLLAALAVWDYCLASARWIFGGAISKALTDELLVALKASPEGMTRTAIYNYFSGHKTSGVIGAALAELDRAGLAEKVAAESAGDRPVEKWRATPTARNVQATTFTSKARQFLAEYRGGNEPEPGKQISKYANTQGEADNTNNANAHSYLSVKSTTIHNVEPQTTKMEASDSTNPHVSQESAHLLICSEPPLDDSPEILSRARARGWRSIVVDGRFVAGGSQGEWRDWLALHTNGERAAVLVALRAEVTE